MPNVLTTDIPRADLPARSGSCLQQKNAVVLHGEYPSRHARQRPAIGQSVLVSSSFLRHYDETKTLLKSQHQICAIGADGEQYAMRVDGKIVIPNELSMFRTKAIDEVICLGKQMGFV